LGAPVRPAVGPRRTTRPGLHPGTAAPARLGLRTRRGRAGCRRPCAQPPPGSRRRRVGTAGGRHGARGRLQVPPTRERPAMTLWRSLRARLVLSHLLVALVSGLVIVVVVRLVAL